MTSESTQPCPRCGASVRLEHETGPPALPPTGKDYTFQVSFLFFSCDGCGASLSTRRTRYLDDDRQEFTPLEYRAEPARKTTFTGWWRKHVQGDDSEDPRDRYGSLRSADPWTLHDVWRAVWAVFVILLGVGCLFTGRYGSALGATLVGLTSFPWSKLKLV